MVVSMKCSYVGQIPSFYPYKLLYDYEAMNIAILTTNNQIS
jgi:hypothetical protein